MGEKNLSVKIKNHIRKESYFFHQPMEKFLVNSTAQREQNPIICLGQQSSSFYKEKLPFSEP